MIGIEADWYRLINDDGEPVLHRPSLFKILDPSEPADWVKVYGEEGELYAYPPELAEPGFFEDWHDGDERTRRIFSEYMARRGEPQRHQ